MFGDLPDQLKELSKISKDRNEKEEEKYNELIGWLDTINDNITQSNENSDNILKAIKSLENELYSQRN